MHLFRLLPLALTLLVPLTALGQGFAPDEAVKRMTLAKGFSAVPVAAEPMIRQPVSMSFDERGRLWVLQYLQYPNYSGLKPVTQDQYLRTVWDKFPEPPPRGPKGTDRLTILYDPDERGVYRKSKDFVNGLNIASGFCIGRGGVFVVQPPYLLFYADKNEDDIPDGDPEVLLSGFGMDDTHSLANSLQWGPDGWLYGAAGSTSTCKIKNPTKPDGPTIDFQQGIWRYHPKTHEFELFSEGGGNTYGLDFDKHGNVIAGTNYGNSAMLHQVQGGYYIKGFSKHGPLHNAHTYGYFDHVPFQNFKGGHVTCGGVLYQADAYPKEFQDTYIAGNLLSNAVYWHTLERNGSTFKAKFGGDMLLANDTWCRPVDLMLGPDGSVYVADFYDRRAAHLDPVDSWDRSNGRIYKLEYQGTPKLSAFDLRQKSIAELVELLKHPNKWWRNEARRMLADRTNRDAVMTLRGAVKSDNGSLALESLWAMFQVGGWDEAFARDVGLKHPSEFVRSWTVRLLGDQNGKPLETPTAEALVELAAKDASAAVRNQLACTAKRLPANQGLPIAGRLMARGADANDPFTPLLIWWAFEDKAISDTKAVSAEMLNRHAAWDTKLGSAILERYARRLASAEPARWQEFIQLVKKAEKPEQLAAILTGADQALQSKQLAEVPAEALGVLQHISSAQHENALLTRVLIRMGDGHARGGLGKRANDPKVADAERVKALELLTQVKDEHLPEMLPRLLGSAKTDAFRLGVLAALGTIDDPKTADLILAGYPNWSPAVKQKAITLLTSRPSWALALLKAVDAGSFPKAELTVDMVRPAVAFKNADVTKLAEKHWGKIGPATPGEKQARISYLNLIIGREGLGDAAKGKELFAKNCAACHQLFGEGGKVGPDLTTADRKNRGYMLAQIVDPSGYIRPEFVSFKVDTADGRALTGLLTDQGESVAITNVVNNQPQKTVIAKKDIDTMNPQPQSLMPEKLLDTLSETEVRHLFAYLLSEPAKPTPAPRKNEGVGEKKLKVVLLSGSFEYESDASLTAYKAYVEKNYPVECTLVAAKAQKDTALAGLEALDAADVVVFFTRRLEIDGDSLAKVKKYIASGKPVVGVRTASHGFQKWLEMDKEVLGGNYTGHYGQKIECAVKLVDAMKDHPILAGVKPLSTAGGLYKNQGISKDAVVLLTGTTKDNTEPVAWVRERKLDGKTQRVFYTSLGTVDDFKNASFTRLLTNGLFWAANRPAPK